MTDQPPSPAAPKLAPAEAPNAQMIVSLIIVVALTVIALAAVVAALVDRSVASVAFGAVGVVVGSLATALNAPNGLANMVAAVKREGPQ